MTHLTLAVLFVSALLPIYTSAFILPQARLPNPSTPPTLRGTADKCTFTLYHKQLCIAGVKKNYIQINSIEDHARDITIDIASLRPVNAHNSYAAIAADRAFRISGLLDDASLTVQGEDGENEVRFEVGGVKFTSEVAAIAGEAGCDSKPWDTVGWKCGMGSRERNMECAFPCGVMEAEVGHDGYGELR